jgi:signal transduction histidine kinase
VSRQPDDHQRVLSEASHDLANHIHRSYYFLELLESAVGPDNSSAHSLVSQLKDSIEKIESIARSTLQFIRPIELRLLRVRLEDLVKSLTQHAGIRSVELTGDVAAGGREILVDPARMSEVLAILCRAAISDAESGLPLVVEMLGGEQVGLRIKRLAQASANDASALSFALIARIADLHGGAFEIQDGDSNSLTLRLPVAAQGT